MLEFGLSPPQMCCGSTNRQKLHPPEIAAHIVETGPTWGLVLKKEKRNYSTTSEISGDSMTTRRSLSL